MFTVCSTPIWAVLTGQTDWVCHIGTLMLCVEAVAWSCIILTWWSGSGGIRAWSRRPTGLLQCFDTVALVIWPVKMVPEMTYNVWSGTLNLHTHSLLATIFVGSTPTVPHQIVSAIYHPPFEKVWLNSVCWSPSAKTSNDVDSRIYIWWVKWRYSLKPFVDQSSWHFETI